MKFRWGDVPEAEGFDPEADGYVPVREPSEPVFLAASLPVGSALFLLLAVGWGAWWPEGWYPLGLYDLAFGLVAIIIVHEWTHALMLPDQGAGENTMFGFYLRYLIFYTHYEGPVDRDQFLLTLLSPFILLSVVPLAFCAAVGEPSTFLRFVSLFNALGSAADVLGFFLVLRRVPKGAILRNSGWKTWWQPA